MQMKWRSFLMNDLILLTDIPLNVQNASVKHDLNKAQTKALAKLELVSDKAFQDITQKGSIPLKDQNNHLLAKLELNEFSAREIQTFAEDLEKTDQERFKSLNWGLRTWDNWYFNDVDHRFGDDWPGRILAQLVAHTLFYFTQKNDLVFYPPYFKKMAEHYMKGSISDFSRSQYLNSRTLKFTSQGFEKG